MRELGPNRKTRAQEALEFCHKGVVSKYLNNKIMIQVIGRSNLLIYPFSTCNFCNKIPVSEEQHRNVITKMPNPANYYTQDLFVCFTGAGFPEEYRQRISEFAVNQEHTHLVSKQDQLELQIRSKHLD